MRITYRNSSVKEYWTARWDALEADPPMKNRNSYPLKYALKAIKSEDCRILECGCGPGRIVSYFNERGYDIAGIDFIESVIQKILAQDPTLNVSVGDVRHLNFKDNTFDTVLAFGLYHNFNDQLEEAIEETIRVLKPSGIICASFRADSWHNKLIDWYKSKGQNDKENQNRHFHKMNLTRFEFRSLFEKHNFHIESIEPVVNMSFLYQFECFRSKDDKQFNETQGRELGYNLNWAGELIQKLLVTFIPNQYCNIYVLIARKPL